MVLALRALNLGDLLVAVPALRAVRRALPEHRLVLAAPAWLRPVVELVDAVDELAPTADLTSLTPLGPAPDVAVNLHGVGPESHRALDALAPRRRVGFRSAGGPGPDWGGPDWSDVAARHPHERARWCALLEAHGMPGDPEDLRLPPPPLPVSTAPQVMVHPGAGFGSKRWPVARFGEVARAFHRSGADVVVTGSAPERDLARRVAEAGGLPAERVLAGRTDLTTLCGLVARAALVVSGDTGIAHVASAFGTPSVVLFGPVAPAQWGPPRGGPHVTLGDAELRRGDPFAAAPDPALLAVTVADVLLAAARVAGRVSVR